MTQSPTATSAAMATKCRYTYKTCPNERTVKKNGELHQLCEYHRTKANSIQKAYATKQSKVLKALRKERMQRRKEALAAAAAATNYHNQTQTIVVSSYGRRHVVECAPIEPFREFSEANLPSLDDLRLLCAILA